MVVLDRDAVRELYSGNDFIVINIIIIIIMTVAPYTRIVKYVVYRVAEINSETLARKQQVGTDYRSNDAFFPVRRSTVNSQNNSYCTRGDCVLYF